MISPVARGVKFPSSFLKKKESIPLLNTKFQKGKNGIKRAYANAIKKGYPTNITYQYSQGRIDCFKENGGTFKEIIILNTGFNNTGRL